MRIPFFRTGTHTAMNGTVVSVDGAELDRRITLYNEQTSHEAPLVIGHPSINGPAFGWVEKLEREGDMAYAETRDEQPEFVDLVKRGLYKKVSASFYPDGLLRHVGFLGATPPAVKGLPAVQFGEDDQAEVYEFADLANMRVSWAFDTVRSLLRGLRDWMIDKEGVEKADALLPSWQVDAVQYEPPQDATATEALYSETPADVAGTGHAADAASDAGSDAGEDAGEAAQETPAADQANYADRVAELERQLAAERAEREAERQRNEIESFCDSPEMRGRITPAMRPVVIEMLLTTRTTDFGEGDDVAPLSEHVRSLLRSLPVQVAFAETATDGIATPSNPDVEEAKKVADEFNRRNG